MNTAHACKVRYVRLGQRTLLCVRCVSFNLSQIHSDMTCIPSIVFLLFDDFTWIFYALSQASSFFFSLSICSSLASSSWIFCHEKIQASFVCLWWYHICILEVKQVKNITLFFCSRDLWRMMSWDCASSSFHLFSVLSPPSSVISSSPLSFDLRFLVTLLCPFLSLLLSLCSFPPPASLILSVQLLRIKLTSKCQILWI